MAKTIACKALKSFAHFVEGHGIVIGDPESSLPEAKKPEVPVSAIETLIANKSIAAPKGWGEAEDDGDPAQAAAPAPDPAPSTDKAP